MENHEEKYLFSRYELGILAVSLAAVYCSSYYNYILFHSLAEFYSVVIAYGIFMLAWNSRRFLTNDYLLFLGIAYLSVGTLDFLHLLAYKGMGVFKGDLSNIATQLWISARYLESLSLLAAPLFFERRIKTKKLFCVFFAVTGFLILSIFLFEIFPDCFREREGLTPFKVFSEYLISGILLGAIIYLFKKRAYFHEKVFQMLVTAIAITILSEMAFTLYSNVYGFANLAGHLLKIISFYLIYKTLIEKGLKNPYETLFRNLKRRNEKVLVQKRMLEEANSTKDKFFSIIAHDLRSPFTGLYSLTAILKNNYDKIPEERKKRYIEGIGHASDELHKLLDNLLLWAASQTGAMQFYPDKLVVKILVESTVSLLNVVAEEKEVQIHWSVEEGVYAYGDENMVRTVMRNLLSNAIKFTPQGGEVNIGVEERDEFLWVSIHDNGVGIPESVLGKLFQPEFKHSTRGTAGERGSGLGLILCRDFVEKCGGRVEVESEEGKGSHFLFSLPCYKEKIRP